ncbi:MAG: hypothetical protein FWE38_02465 [Firmicutes bacterium]|nr:hypothetical protein [Bacillota bacterium]
MTKPIKWTIIALAAIAVVLTPILVIFVFGDDDEATEFSLVRPTSSMVFNWDFERDIMLPAIAGLEEDDTLQWSITAGSEFALINAADGLSFRFLGPIADSTEENLTFRADITRGTEEFYLIYNLRVRNPRMPFLDRIFSPNQSGRISHRIQGIARERVFGLYDVNPTGGYTRSGDVMQLAWRYAGEVILSAYLQEPTGTNTDGTPIWPTSGNVDPETDDVLRFEFDEEANRVDIEFHGVGVRRVLISGHSVADPSRVVTYSYVYDIRDAINAFTFDDVKAVEFNARMEYIVNGVRLPCGRQLIAPLSETAFTIDDFYIPGREGQLNSRRFALEIFHILDTANFPREIIATEYLREFWRWSPSFRYRDLVIRDNMQTWAEGTWFFGNVFGNGFTLDATPYAAHIRENTLQSRVFPMTSERGFEYGAYRNVHGMGFDGFGMENDTGRRGQGWGEKFSFQMLANHTTLDNIHLIGDNFVHPSGRPTRLNDFVVKSVLGTSNIGGPGEDDRGNAKPFQVGLMAHTEGVINEGMYNAGHRVQNSIIEKGLHLITPSYIPNAEHPFEIDTVVLRYAGFTAVYGRGFGGREGGRYLRNNNDQGMVDGVYEYVDTDWTNVGQQMRFGNFITVRNILVYEICTAPIILDENDGGTFFQFKGNSNHFYTWIRLLDLVFPDFKFPIVGPFTSMTVAHISQIAQDLIEETILRGEYSNAAVPDGVTHRVSLPLISVGNYAGNYWRKEADGFDINVNAHVLDVPVTVTIPGQPPVGYILRAMFFIPNGSHVPTTQEQDRAFAYGGIADIIRSMNIRNP